MLPYLIVLCGILTRPYWERFIYIQEKEKIHMIIEKMESNEKLKKLVEDELERYEMVLFDGYHTAPPGPADSHTLTRFLPDCKCRFILLASCSFQRLTV